MTFKNNIKLLNSYKSRSNQNNDNIVSIISLYEAKKIPNMKTAENAIVLLTSKHKATVTKALDNYEKVISKYKDATPITGRLSEPGFLTVSLTHLVKPKSQVQLDIRTSDKDRFDNALNGAEQLPFEAIFKKIKEIVLQETFILLDHKKSMKLKLGVKFEVGK